MVAVLGPYEALPYYIHTYIHTYQWSETRRTTGPVIVVTVTLIVKVSANKTNIFQTIAFITCHGHQDSWQVGIRRRLTPKTCTVAAGGAQQAAILCKHFTFFPKRPNLRIISFSHLCNRITIYEAPFYAVHSTISLTSLLRNRYFLQLRVLKYN
jgi:hypothetical protein